MRIYRSNRSKIGFILDKENSRNIKKEAHDEPMIHTWYTTVKKRAQNI